MLARKYHLPKSFFAKLPKKSNQIDSEIFTVKEYNSDLSYSRFGVSISSKIISKAVLRNKIKRIIYDFVRRENIYKNSRKDFLFIIKSKISSASKVEIEKELKKIL